MCFKDSAQGIQKIFFLMPFLFLYICGDERNISIVFCTYHELCKPRWTRRFTVRTDPGKTWIWMIFPPWLTTYFSSLSGVGRQYLCLMYYTITVSSRWRGQEKMLDSLLLILFCVVISKMSWKTESCGCLFDCPQVVPRPLIRSVHVLSLLRVLQFHPALSLGLLYVTFFCRLLVNVGYRSWNFCVAPVVKRQRCIYYLVFCATIIELMEEQRS